jgi:hypothetical protein
MLAPIHPRLTRRTALQAGAVGILGLGTNHLTALRAASPEGAAPARARSVIFIFLSGGLSQLDSFDLKPQAPDSIRGEFKPIATRTPGVQICEHLPRLAERSHLWSLVRSLTHPYNEHSQGHLAVLCGQTPMPLGFDPNKPQPSDCPAIAAVAGAVTARRNNLPPAVVLPEKLMHFSGRLIPGQFAGQMGAARDPWFLELSRYNPKSYGAWPEYGFHHERGAENPADFVFQAPHLALPQGVDAQRMAGRLGLLERLARQRASLAGAAESGAFDRHRELAVSLLADSKVQSALDVTRADAATQDRYGRNTFGWSLLLARRLVEAGVNLVQVNLGNDETWDTHQANFRCLKDFLFPPTDKAVSALLDDLHQSGLLESTLVVMAGEFGRTPRIFKIPKAKLPGRDHWGAVQSVLLAGGGLEGGRVVGASDKIGDYPAVDPQRPENLAATIYQSLGIPRLAVWRDPQQRPHQVYSGDPIPGLA